MTKYVWVTGLLIILTIAGVVFSRFGSGGPATVAQSIKIGFMAPLSGDTAIYGENQQKGLLLALEQINKTRAVGQQIQIVTEDTKCDSKLAVSAAQKLITVDHVAAIIGDTCSSAVLAMMPIVTQNHVVAVTPTAGSDKISGSSPYVFRNFVANRQYAEFSAPLIKNTLGKDKLAVLYIENDLGENLKDDIAKNFTGTLTLAEGYAADTKDFRTLLIKVTATHPDMVFLAGYYNDGALIVKQAKELGLQFQFFGGGDAYDDPQFIALAGKEAAEGFIYVSVPLAHGPQAEKFLNLYKEKYHADPPVYSDVAYDTLYALTEALKNVNTPNELPEELRNINFEGASNVITFDDQGDLKNPTIVVKQIKGGKASIVDLH